MVIIFMLASLIYVGKIFLVCLGITVGISILVKLICRIL